MKAVVVKLGSGVLTTDTGQLDNHAMATVAASVMAYRSITPVVMVSSGAILCGARFLNQPITTLATKQAAAAIGQSQLMAEYWRVFQPYHVSVAQVLLTHDSFDSLEKRENSMRTLAALLDNNIIPIINENDTVSTAALNLGDNDQLASLTARLIGAQHLVLLSTVDGVYDTAGHLLDTLTVNHQTIDAIADDDNRSVSNGGMRSKLQAAQQAVQAGIPVTIANGRTENSVYRAIKARNIGTQIKTDNQQVV